MKSASIRPEHRRPVRRLLVCSTVAMLTLCLGPFQSLLAQDQPKEPTPLHLGTENYDLRFSANNSGPVQWDLLLPSTHDEPQDQRQVILIDQVCCQTALHPPFQLVLFTQEDPKQQIQTVALNLSNISSETTSENENEIIRFEGLLAERDLKVVQTFSIPKTGFLSKLTISLHNTGSEPQTFDQGLGISLGPGLGSPQEAPNTLAFINKPDEGTRIAEPLDSESQQLLGPLHWAGLQGRYYTLAILPNKTARFGQSMVFLDPGLAESKLISPEKLPMFPSLALSTEAFTVAPGESVQHEFMLYAGPRSRQLLREAHAGLEDTIYCHLWRWLAALCVLLESVLTALHSILGNWGISIVVLALGVRICMFPLSRYGIREQHDFQKKQAQVKPLLAKIKRQYKGDILKINEETLRIYKENGITTMAPLKSCLPLMIQLPILFAFYQLLSNSYDLNGVPFLWIQDLAQPDRLFSPGFSLPLLGDAVNLLPILMFACHIAIARDLQSSSNSGSAKPKLSSYALPLAMLVLFYPFPAGCMLYWTIGSISQVFEQRLIRKQIRETSAASPENEKGS